MTLQKDPDGNLMSADRSDPRVFKYYDGCYDFYSDSAGADETRVVYDDHYARADMPRLTLASLTAEWRDPTVPWRATMLQTLGSLSDRNVLLLGNGASYREFYFLHLGAHLIFTDLSLTAAKRAQVVFSRSELSEKYYNNIEFHAMDAMHLPFPDESLDIIYGAKFVGFLNDQEIFFSEVMRCLKPGGICRFADDADSPLWNGFRRLLILPAKVLLWEKMSSLSKVRSGFTPRNTFGFKEESLLPFAEQFGFSRMLFLRQYFFLRIAQLAWGKLVHFDPKRLIYAKPVYLALKWVDLRLAKTAWMQRNSLSLTWGFDK